MAIILDTNCFSHVFSPKDSKHAEFRPVLEWVIKDKGFFVYGGSKYKKELGKCTKYLRFFRLLKEVGKVIEFDQEKIDNYQNIVERKEHNPDFDDPHLPARVVVSHCELICSRDGRSIRFVTRKDLYPKRFVLPKYYKGLENKSLLKETSIPNQLHQYKKKLRKKQVQRIMAIIDSVNSRK